MHSMGALAWGEALPRALPFFCLELYGHKSYMATHPKTFCLEISGLVTHLGWSNVDIIKICTSQKWPGLYAQDLLLL